MKSVVDIVKSKLPANTSITDTDIANAIEEVKAEIYGYCNFDDTDALPEGLYYTCANMAVDLLKYTQASLTPTPTTIDPSIVSSIKIGDTQINMQNSKSHRVNMDDLLMNYRSQLNRFRRMVW